MNQLCANCNHEIKETPVRVPLGTFCGEKCHVEFVADMARAKGHRVPSAIFDNPDPVQELWPDIKWGNTQHWTE